jgi:alpha-glucosidase
VPIPWSGSEPPYGFGPGTGQPWLPQPAGWGSLSVEAQDTDPASTLAFYRRAIAARRTLLGGPGTVEILGDHGLGEDVLAFRRGDLTVLLNCGSSPVALPEGEVVVASGELREGDRELPGDTAVWLR